MLKFTADEHKNLNLFKLLNDFLFFLNRKTNPAVSELGLAKFKIAFLEAVGFKIHFNQDHGKALRLSFSNNKGGFTTMKTSDAVPVLPETFLTFFTNNKASFEELGQLQKLKNLPELQKLLSGFLEFHLEREIKSQRFLDMEDVV